MSNSTGMQNNPPTCRACKTQLKWMMADLGSMPLANSYLLEEDVPDERSYPLEVMVCHHCYLAQVTTAVPPQEIFSDYAYFSSFSSSWLAHAKNYCEHIQQFVDLNENSLVMEVASNDGYLLKNFVEQNVPVLGIEPAKNIAQYANEQGIRTHSTFLNGRSAGDIVASFGQADLLIGNNVLAHVPDTPDFIEGLAALLGPKGLLTMEFPHLLRLLQERQFDTIYHEHYSYLSLTCLKGLFANAGLAIHHVEQLPSHGGSLRIHASHLSEARELTDAVKSLLEEENLFGITKVETYDTFNQIISSIKEQLVDMLASFQEQGKSVIAYGAAAKGNTLLNYCGLTHEDIDYVVDRNPDKQNKLMPGNHIPIVAENKIKETRPDYILILPWNLSKEIMHQLTYCREWGAKFITPIPKPEIF